MATMQADLPTDFPCLRTHSGADGVTSRLERMAPADLSAGEVLIRNRFAGVNYKDCLSILGRARIIESYPRIAGIEAVGEVVHSSDARFAPGQPVIVHGFRTGIAFDGGFAQYLRAPAAHVMPLPAGLDAWQAAVIGVPGFTAGMALDRFMQAGLTAASGAVAVSGASGAVGMLATAILSRAGWQVCALTRKPEQADALRALGGACVGPSGHRLAPVVRGPGAPCPADCAGCLARARIRAAGRDDGGADARGFLSC
jgi:acrylyl-CoA reductase (NADPH)